MQADFVVLSKDYQPQLIVEVKRKSGVSDDWVMQLRKNLLAYDFIPPSPYFLMLLSDYSYLWKQPADIDASPDYKIETSKLLSIYIDETRTNLQELGEYSLALLVSIWLNDLIDDPSMEAAEIDGWLQESGLYDAIKGGLIISEAMA